MPCALSQLKNRELEINQSLGFASDLINLRLSDL